LEKLLVDESGDYGQVLNCLLFDFEADIVSQGQNLQADELLAQVFTEAFAHIAKELDCYDAVILVVIVVSHFDHMLKNKVPSILIIKFMSEISKLFSSLLLGLDCM